MSTDAYVTSFVGTLVALFSAGVVWLIRSAQEKHKKESLALARIERIFALNLTRLNDNLEFIENWIAALEINRPYSFYIASLTDCEDESYKIGDLDLINKLLNANHKMLRVTADLNNVYKSYWDTIKTLDGIPDEERREANVAHFHKTVVSVLREMMGNYGPLEKESIQVVAMVRVLAHVRKHSLFSYAALLNRDVFPRLTKSAVKKEIDEITAQVDERKKQSSRHKFS